MKQKISLSLLTVGCLCLLAACGSKTDTATPSPAAPSQAAAEGAKPPATSPAPAAGPAVPVTTALAQRQSLRVATEATGTATPLSQVDVKAQMSGVVTQVHVKEGQAVRAGQLLFTLDTRADEANVAKLKAQISKDEALLADAQRQLARARELLSKNFVSQGAVDTAQTNVESQQATLAADKAALAAAQVPLSYGRVTAASAGRVGLVPVYVGTAVQANLTTLTTLTQLDTMDVSFSLPQSNLPDVLGLLAAGKAPVKATLPDGKTALTGRLNFVDSVVDAATGTVKVKARFDNKDNTLWPGAYVKVSLPLRTLDEAVTVPTVSVIQSARGPLVYVVEEGKAAPRPVKVLDIQGEVAAVSGVNEGDKVVVNGRQNLRPGTSVTEKAPGKPGDKAGDKAGDKPGDKATDKAADKATEKAAS